METKARFAKAAHHRMMEFSQACTLGSGKYVEWDQCKEGLESANIVSQLSSRKLARIRHQTSEPPSRSSRKRFFSDCTMGSASSCIDRRSMLSRCSEDHNLEQVLGEPNLSKIRVSIRQARRGPNTLTIWESAAPRSCILGAIRIYGRLLLCLLQVL